MNSFPSSHFNVFVIYIIVGNHLCEDCSEMYCFGTTVGGAELPCHRHPPCNDTRGEVSNSLGLDSIDYKSPVWLSIFFLYRLSRYQQFKDFQKRILVATNLFGRGMDIERVNIVFNYDMPDDSDTYLHRVCALYLLFLGFLLLR